MTQAAARPVLPYLQDGLARHALLFSDYHLPGLRRTSTTDSNSVKMERLTLNVLLLTPTARASHSQLRTQLPRRNSIRSGISALTTTESKECTTTRRSYGACFKTPRTPTHSVDTGRKITGCDSATISRKQHTYLHPRLGCYARLGGDAHS